MVETRELGKNPEADVAEDVEKYEAERDWEDNDSVFEEVSERVSGEVDRGIATTKSTASARLESVSVNRGVPGSPSQLNELASQAASQDMAQIKPIGNIIKNNEDEQNAGLSQHKPWFHWPSDRVAAV